MSTEFGDEKTCFSPSAASAGGFPRMVRDILVVARPLAWRISPGCPWIENFRGFGIRFDNTFLLLLHGLFFSFAFCFRVHVSISTSTVFFCRITGTVCTRGTDTFSALAHSFSPFVSHFDTHFLHLGDSPVLCGSTQSYGTCTHMRAKAEISKQLTRASTSVPVLCDSSAESPAWCSSSQTTELHPSSVF